jgi:hypothetical protein
VLLRAADGRAHQRTLLMGMTTRAAAVTPSIANPNSARYPPKQVNPFIADMASIPVTLGMTSGISSR